MKYLLELGKIDYRGIGRKQNAVTLTVEIKERTGGKSIDLKPLETCKELLVSGSIWNASRTDILAGGQCATEILLNFKDRRVQRLCALWDRWHLNCIRAGCRHQIEEKWAERPIDPSKPTNTYGKFVEDRMTTTWNQLVWVSRKKHPQGLLSEPCPICGYRYGTEWLIEELPDEVVSETKFLCESLSSEPTFSK